MTDNFNPKMHQGKDRVYCAVPGRKDILRLYVWDCEKGRYDDPKSGMKYDTRRVEIGENGKRRRKKKMFKSLEESVLWQQGNDPSAVAIKSAVSLQEFIRSSSKISSGGMTFKELIAKFREDHYPTLDLSTRTRYNRLLEKYFGSIESLVVVDTKPQTIDLWLKEVKKVCGEQGAKQRKFYKHELDMLRTLLSYYKEYFDDDNEFVLPLRKRHSEVAYNGHEKENIADLNVEQFIKFRSALLNVKYGGKFAIMATIQFFQALRISEAAAFQFEDFKLNFPEPSQSRVVISRGVKWKRDTKQPTDLGTLKNSEHIGGAKEQPVFPEVYQMLMAVFPDFETRKGLMFTDEEGKLFEYRQIQRAFDRAFEIAGLDFTGTHIMRHGGCRVLLNETGDRYIAQQHLGNSSLKSTDVYAIREAKALTKAVEKRWEVFPGGRKWSQS